MAKHATGWWISGDDSGTPTIQFRTDISPVELGDDADVLVEVTHSALNYKDALAISGNPGVIRTLPLIPGIDAVGTVAESSDRRFAVGSSVVLTGFGYGETRHGGLATSLRAVGDHLVSLPGGLSHEQAAAYGTAGFTAALALHALEKAGLTPENQQMPIAVSGAAGAVGSLAMLFLSRRGFHVTAITGRTDEHEYLKSMGANEILSRQEVLSWPERPLLSERFGGVIDQAGGPLLARLLASTNSSGVVASCGLAGGSDLPTTVMPFILRGITLTGINSVYQPLDVRRALWQECAALAGEIPWSALIKRIRLEDAETVATHVLVGATRGRVVVEMPR